MTGETTLPDEAAARRQPSLLDAADPGRHAHRPDRDDDRAVRDRRDRGPLQVALLTSAVVAGLVAFKNGHSSTRVRDAAIGGISSALGAVFILLAVGALIGTWNMAGTIPTIV